MSYYMTKHLSKMEDPKYAARFVNTLDSLLRDLFGPTPTKDSQKYTENLRREAPSLYAALTDDPVKGFTFRDYILNPEEAEALYDDLLEWLITTKWADDEA